MSCYLFSGTESVIGMYSSSFLWHRRGEEGAGGGGGGGDNSNKLTSFEQQLV